MVFAPYRDELINELAHSDALAVLEDALERTKDEDMRTETVRAALRYLYPLASRKWAFKAFWKALDFENPNSRWQNANAALNGIRTETGANVFRKR